jgi:hypothetical protein
MTDILWHGRRVTTCDICYHTIDKEFIDGVTTRGPWGLMHPTCHAVFGKGIGPSRGVHYVKRDDGRFVRKDR